MEILSITDIMRAFVVATAYVIVVSAFFEVHKKTSCVSYWLLIFSAMIIGIITGEDTILNAVAVLVTTLYLCRTHDTLKSLNIAVTIFATFQWIVAFVGSGAFILLYSGHIIGTLGLIGTLSAALIITAMALRRFKHIAFKEISRQSLLMDTAAKLFFVLFFNAFLPRFFMVMGGAQYSILTLVLLGVTVIFVVYKNYTISLERKVAEEQGRVIEILAWAERTLAKYVGIEFPTLAHVNQISSPVLRALLYEFADTAHSLGIAVDISVTGSVGAINVSDYDLYKIVSGFIAQSLQEAVALKDARIGISVDGRQGFHILVKTEKNHSRGDITVDMDARCKAAIDFMKKHLNSSITINADRYQLLQVLSIM